MDTSPVESTSKCSSDFSIKRILSSDNDRHTGGRGDILQVPDWLCCTRYRPPRLPRAVNGGGCRARRSGRHARVPFTAAQAAALEAAYARAPYLAPPALRALAAALQLRDDRIKIWFQNRRARERREKCATIAPPVAVTLPPTTNTLPRIKPICSWTTISGGIASHSLNFNTVVQSDETINSSRIVVYRRPDDSNEDSLFKNAANDCRSDTPLDIETIDD